MKLLLLAAACVGILLAQAKEEDSRAALEKRFHYKTGTIDLPGGVAKIGLDSTFRYLDPNDSQLLLTEGWGNPPGAATLGMLVPAKISPFSREGWAVVITYDEDGYVKDDDAEKIDYTALLKEMQQGTESDNEERKKAGYEAVKLVGWAAPPHYDKAAHKLYWAKELSFEGSKENTLNYNIRVLGRRGVLVLNAVSARSQLAQVEKDMSSVMQFVDFQQGHRYSDYMPGADKVATYGIAALVAGKVAAKVGFLKGILLALVAGKKFVVLALAGIGSFLAKLFGRKKEVQEAEAAPPSPEQPA
ncbi:MAG: DUF2167 domain-containing protein [Bryobacteraceae bacterium]